MLKAAVKHELQGLVGEGVSPETAIEEGALTKVKLRQRWLYLSKDLDVDEALDQALRATESYLEEWLLGRPPFLLPGALKCGSGEIGKGAFDLLIKELAAEDRLGGIALLNVSYQPFIAFHRRADDEEITRQVKALSELLKLSGRVHGRDLPSPRRPVPRQTWRETVIRHGEWRGWGQHEDGALVAWR